MIDAAERAFDKLTAEAVRVMKSGHFVNGLGGGKICRVAQARYQVDFLSHRSLTTAIAWSHQAIRFIDTLSTTLI